VVLIGGYVGLVFSILEVAADPSYTIFFLEAWQKRPFCHLCLLWVAAGCIFFLQAVQR
jgi:hypothetical protein